MFYKIHSHYIKVGQQLRVAQKQKVQLHDYDGATVIVLVGNVTRVTKGAINYARSIGDYVIAMHVSFDENPGKEHKTANEFKAEYPDVRFVVQMFVLLISTRLTGPLRPQRCGLWM